MTSPLAARRALLIGVDRYPHIADAELQGGANDAHALAAVLSDRWGFSCDLLLDEDATRAGILGALGDLADRTHAGDTVVVAFSGHGGRARVGDDTADAWSQTLVPTDSGRGATPNRDVLAHELDTACALLEDRGADVTLIIDAGTRAPRRSVATDAGRGLLADERPPSTSGHPTAAAAPRTRSLAATASSTGWPPGDRRKVLAACRADEIAYEQREGPSTFGAFTMGLTRVLAGALLGSSWKVVLEAVANGIRAKSLAQTPAADGPLAGAALGEPTREPGVPVQEVRPDQLLLGGGAAHGLTVGSRWRVGVHDIEILAVRATSAAATRPDKASIKVGDWAVPVATCATLGLAVSVPETLAERVAASRLIYADPDADVVVAIADPGERRFGAPSAGAFMAIGRDGRLVARVTHEPAALIQSLEGVARFRQILSLGKPTSRLTGYVDLQVLRVTAAGAVPATSDPGGLPVFEEGDRAEIVVRNDYADDVYVSVLELGVDGAIGLLLPDPDGPPEARVSTRLAPGAELRVGRDVFGRPEGLPLSLPADFPWGAQGGDLDASGILSLKLFATLAETSFVALEQGATRAAAVPSAHPLEAALEAACGYSGARSFRPGRYEAPEDWTTVTRAVAVRRRAARYSLTGGALTHGAGIVVHAPGVAGEVRIDLGDGGRTRAITGEAALLTDAMAAAGLTTLATITREGPALYDTRAVTGAATVDVPDVGDGRRIAGLALSDDGFPRWILPERHDGDAGAGWRLRLPRLERAFKVIAFRSVQSAVATWETRFRAPRLRAISPDAPVDTRTVPALSRADLTRLAEGPALLLVHGTFATTPLAFAGLGDTCVAALRDRYDGRVFALDHPSLSADPEDNVKWLVGQLPPRGHWELDVVGHSRGGLVARALAAWGPTLSSGRVSVRRVVCVATPNRGTALARTQHAAELATVVTGMVHQADRTGASADRLAGPLALLKSVGGDLVEALPGLTAMDPDGLFLRRLAAAEDAARTTMYSVAARFTAPRDGGGLDRFAELLTREIFGEGHDLVVPSDGVRHAHGPAFPIPAPRHLEVQSAGVWHNSLFAVPQVQRQLLSWLT